MSNLESNAVTHMRFIQIIILGILLVATGLTIQSSETFHPRDLVLPHDAAPQRDAGLQQTVDRTMSGHPGTLVVVDVSSGAILASNNLRLA